MYKLHYARIDNMGDVDVFRFKTAAKMVDFIDEKCIRRNGQCVWLLAKEKSTDIFISESHMSIQDFLESKNTWNCQGEYFLQEYESFEEAYKVALSMQEISPLCYSKTNTQ